MTNWISFNIENVFELFLERALFLQVLSIPIQDDKAVLWALGAYP